MLRTEKGRRKGTERAQRDKPLDGSRGKAPSQDNSHIKMAKGMTRIGLQELFMLEENTKGTIGHSLKLAKMRCTRDCWRHFFLTG